MSDLEPPSYFDEAPPPEAGGAGPSGGRRRREVPKLSKDEIAKEAAEFFTWLTHHERTTEFKVLLPEKISPAIFIDSCKTAVTKKPQFLQPEWRQSLMLAVMDAANCGLMPDGKEGAIVPRYDSDAREMRLVFQPMVWGIVKLGRETGAIRSIRAKIAFFGEPFRVMEGETDLIEHEAIPEIAEAAYADLYGGIDRQSGNVIARPDVFLGHVRAAYCFITGVDGTVTRRWMTRARLIILKNSSRARNGPWNSAWVDEMILKAVILFTSKWINLDVETASARRFQAALSIDSAADMPDETQIDRPDSEQPLALAAPGPKLDMFADMFANAGREKVTASRNGAPAHPTQKAAEPPRDQPAPEPQEGPSDPPTDDLMARVNSLVTTLAGYNKNTLPSLIEDQKYKNFVAEVYGSQRRDLIVKLRDAVTTAVGREP